MRKELLTNDHRLTIANQMLSLVGSLQPDPFSPQYAPKSVSLSDVPLQVGQNQGDNPQAEPDSIMQDWEDEREETLIDLVRASDEGAEVGKVDKIPVVIATKAKKKRKKDAVALDETPNAQKKKKKSS